METKDIIKELRKKHSYTVEQVSLGAGISKSVYPKYESGILNAGVPVLCKLADFYGVTVDYLLGREETKKPDILTQLAQEFDLTETEKVIVQAYIAISPKEREKFIKAIEEVARKKEITQPVKIQANIPLPKRAIARNKDNPYCDAPTPEQIANFTPVPEDIDL